ncbi:amidohydrolase family protein [Amycolatopsis sp. H20-H5]|uniref:amidohydrolase family protein n=1 Tax=Amycolatopsis sp. H20-H5 TaxID=3046309 RepID=UPI002DB87A01|nr:amidohydrolase family protein [Amycolatopsis sp. H20-H5]MEC3982496.1 amidohydrolase family protein [Amycolatopsis sp. H20-H5]
MVFRVRGITLPDRVEQTFVVDGDQLRVDPASGAELLSDGGWLLPGLVDTHTHPGTEATTDTFDEDRLRRHLRQHRDAGVLLVRVPGAAARIPKWVDDEPDLPRVHSAGRWLATPGRFYENYGRDISENDLAKAAVEESLASSGWCKIIGDWSPQDRPVPLDVLSDAVAAVHAVGGRVAVHGQTAEGCHNAVMAGADSLEHGMHLDPALLGRMAAQGTALIPTFTTFDGIVERARANESDPLRDWLIDGWDGMLATVRAAFDAGVTVLAGTDCLPFGNVTTEIDWLLKAGLPPEAAVGAASWTARAWLGVPGLRDGAPADLVVYDEDPTADPGVLARPKRIILRGQVIR